MKCSGRNWVRIGAKTSVFAVIAFGLVWALGWWHVHRDGAGLETLGIAIGYGLVMLALCVVAVVGLIMMLIGAVRGRGGRGSGEPPDPPD